MDARKEVVQFSTLGRKLFTILALQICLNPWEALKIMAFWLCLERLGFRNTLKTIRSLSNVMIRKVADEAITCLSYLTATRPFISSPKVHDLSLTQLLISKEISIQFLDKNRSSVMMCLTEVAYDVCYLTLMDIMQEAEERNAARHSADTDRMIASLPDPAFIIGGNELPPPPPVHPDERTLFVTFSNGNGVSEEELRDFLTRYHGDCIETIYMEKVKPGKQPFYARIVFHSPSTSEAILSGEEKAKFTINSKHAWMRRFVPKNKKAPSAEKGLLPLPKGLLPSQQMHHRM